MPQYRIEVIKSPSGKVSELLYTDIGTHAGTADDIESLEKEFKDFISANHNVSIKDITFSYE